MNVVHIFPERTTKVLPEEPITFTVSVQGAADTVEIWTDMPSTEYKKNEFHAIPLRLEKTEGDIHIFSRTITPITCGFYTFSVRQRTGNRWLWLGGSYEQRDTIDIHVEPSWAASTILYNAFVRQFSAKDRNNDGIIEPGEGGTFKDLVNRLDYFKKLSVGAIYLNPIQITGEIFQYDDKIRPHYQDETNHLPIHMHPGSVYTVKEYKSIDPELGVNPDELDTDQYIEFKRFVAACHKQGIRVILDVVFDHTARDSFIQRLHPEWFLYKKDPRSLDGPYIYHDSPEAEQYWGKPEYAFAPYDHDIFWTDCAQLNWNYLFAPAENEPPLNPTIEDMRAYFLGVLKYWVRQYGVDGFRLDVSYAIPTDFWHEAVQECRVLAEELCKKKNLNTPLSPEILFIGETYVDKVVELQECGLSMLNGDFVWKLFSVESLKGYLDYVYNISGNHFPAGSRWLHFTECHDGPRLMKKFADNTGSRKAELALAKSRWALTAFLPGMPMIHNGFEVLEHENVSVRTYSGINWESKHNVIDYLAAINKVRAKYVALQRGSYTFVESEQGVTNHAQLYAFFRQHKKETFLVVVNMDIHHEAKHVWLRLPDIAECNWEKKYILHDVLTGKKYTRDQREVNISLNPGESHVFKISQ